MLTIEALILGAVQGLTEFLPVSSSGHLALVQSLMGFKDLDHYILFDLICHLGTLAVICIVFWKDIIAMLGDSQKRLAVVLGTLPLFPLVLILKPIKALFNQPQYLGFFFMITAFLLFLSQRFSTTKESRQLFGRRDSIIVGICQAFAILPGVSRSGSTISGARLLGWSPQEAVTFSFLLAIPAILGGTVLEMMNLFKPDASSVMMVGWVQLAAGFAAAFGMGFLALNWLRKLAVNHKLNYFAWYCLLLGAATVIYFN